jgi:aspartate beta-hydroxylase
MRRETQLGASAYFDRAITKQGPDGKPLLNWINPWQLPVWYIPGLEAKPYWAAMDFEVSRVMLENFDAIRQDVLQLVALDEQAAADENSGLDGVFELQMDYELVRQGNWSEFLLYDGGEWFDHRCAVVPAICQLLSGVAEVAGIMPNFDDANSPGQITILRMDAGTELESHCGPRNSRLTAHLGVIVPPPTEPSTAGSSLRVGPPENEGARREWKEGEVIVFDDSFEHEASNPTNSPRYVVYASLWHPSLGSAVLPPERRWPPTDKELAEPLLVDGELPKRKGRRKKKRGKREGPTALGGVEQIK